MDDLAGILDLEFIELVLIAAAGSNPRSPRNQGVDQGLPDAIAASGDYHHFISEKILHTFCLKQK
jgi:hypothetical protein